MYIFKNKFNLTDDILEIFQGNDINGENFFDISDETIDQFLKDKETQISILNYIMANKKKFR